MTDEEIVRLAEAISKHLLPGCPFNEKQQGTLKATANVIRIGGIAFLSGVGATGAGLLLAKLLG